jgi:hypothetical protein
MSGELAMWTDEYEAAPMAASPEGLLADSEYTLRAIGCALKPTGWATGPMAAAVGAGIVLAGLRAAGWDVVRVKPGKPG